MMLHCAQSEDLCIHDHDTEKYRWRRNCISLSVLTIVSKHNTLSQNKVTKCFTEPKLLKDHVCQTPCHNVPGTRTPGALQVEYVIFKVLLSVTNSVGYMEKIC